MLPGNITCAFKNKASVIKLEWSSNVLNTEESQVTLLHEI